MSDLYRQELLDVFKNPTYRGSLPDPKVSVTERNTFCGDVLSLDLKVEDGKVVDARFDGEMCMVSLVSADLFLDTIIGKSLDELKKVDKETILQNFDTSLTTSRVKCALLVLEALKEVLKKYE